MTCLFERTVGQLQDNLSLTLLLWLSEASPLPRPTRIPVRVTRPRDAGGCFCQKNIRTEQAYVVIAILGVQPIDIPADLTRELKVENSLNLLTAAYYCKGHQGTRGLHIRFVDRRRHSPLYERGKSNTWDRPRIRFESVQLMAWYISISYGRHASLED